MGGFVGNVLGDVGDALGGVVSGVGNVVEDVAGGVTNTVSDIAESDLGKAALIGGALYGLGGLGGVSELLGGVGTAAAGEAALGTAAAAPAVDAALAGVSDIAGLGFGNAASDAAVNAALAGTAAATPAVNAALTGAGAAGGSALGSAASNAAFNSALANAGGGLLSNAALTGGALALAGALAGNKPSSSTTTTSIDPQIKEAYLANLEEARKTAEALGPKELADFTAQYGTAEQQLENLGLGGVGQKTVNEAVRLAMQEAGYTPQQITAATTGEAALTAAQGYTPGEIAAAQINRQNVANVTGTLGSQFMGAYQNPYETQVVQAALGDIDRQRRLAQQAGQARATAARAFGGSRQAVAEALANEDFTRQAANTAAQLRQQGFTTAAQLGQTDAARLLQAQLANQGVDVTLEQANAQLLQQSRLANQAAINQAGQFGASAANQAALANAAARNQMAQYNAQLAQQAALANQAAMAQGAGIRQSALGQLGALGAQQQNLGMTGAQSVMNAQLQRQALAQARLDAARNLALERLGIRQSALGMQPANLGQIQTSPLYRNTGSSLLGGALLGSRLGSNIPEVGAGYGALAGGLLGLL